jgi:hypothetical protein
MMSARTQTTGYQKGVAWGACLCVGVLLMATFAQALDSCEFAQLRTSQQVCADHSVRNAPTICLVCAAAHAASLASPISSALAPLRVAGFSGTAREVFHPALQMFALHVRPPPSL